MLRVKKEHKNCGMTLVEILVSLVIMMIVLGAIFSILNLQRTKAINVQSTTILQTDAEIAASLLRWDLFMAGYGIAPDRQSIVSYDNTTAPDSVTLYGAGLAFEAKATNWTPVLQVARQSNKIIVYRFPEPSVNIGLNDRIIIVDQNKMLLDSNLIITQIDTTQYLGGEDSMPAFELTLSRSVNAPQGAIIFRTDSITYFNGITYKVVGKTLKRGNDDFLENVEDIQFAYGIDLNDNGTFEANEWFNNLSDIPNYEPTLLYRHKNAIRSTFVVLSNRRLNDYRYLADSITNENHSYNLSALDKRYKRKIVRAISWPRNLQF